MARFRIITEKCNWTVEDDKINDATVFLSEHFYKSPTAAIPFIVIEDAVINLNKLIAIERL